MLILVVTSVVNIFQNPFRATGKKSRPAAGTHNRNQRPTHAICLGRNESSGNTRTENRGRAAATNHHRRGAATDPGRNPATEIQTAIAAPRNSQTKPYRGKTNNFRSCGDKPEMPNRNLPGKSDRETSRIAAADRFLNPPALQSRSDKKTNRRQPHEDGCISRKSRNQTGRKPNERTPLLLPVLGERRSSTRNSDSAPQSSTSSARVRKRNTQIAAGPKEIDCSRYANSQRKSSRQNATFSRNRGGYSPANDQPNQSPHRN